MLDVSDLVVDHARMHGAAAWRVDAQDHGLGGVFGECFFEGVDDVIGVGL